MTPNEIQNKTFEKKMGGYRPEEVHSYLEQVAASMKALLDEKEELGEKMAVLAEKLEEYREDEDSLRAALIGAQKLGDSVVRDAKKKAEMLLSEAAGKAEELVNDARSNIDREALALARMQGQVAEFKQQILNLYKRHIEMIKAIPEEQVLPRDVKALVDQASAGAEAIKEPAAQPASEQPESFVLTYDELEEAGQESSDGQSSEQPAVSAKPHKRSNYGDLRFGEEYSLTRND